MLARPDTLKFIETEDLLLGPKPSLAPQYASSVKENSRIVELEESRQNFAQDYVATGNEHREEKPSGMQKRQTSVPVYDLTVDDEHEFFANGVLVHNSTEGGKGARTAGVLLGDLGQERAIAAGLPQYWLVHVEAGRWSDAERESRIKALAALDNKTYGNVTIGMEQEPGSGGRHSAYMTVTNLAGYDVFAERATTNKSARWSPPAAQLQAGNMAIVTDDTWDWAATIRELDALAGDARTAYADFQNLDKGKLKDVADALSGAFKYLAGNSTGLTVEGDLIASGEPGFEDEEEGLYSAEEKAELPEFLRELIDETDNLDDDRDHGRGMNWDRD